HTSTFSVNPPGIIGPDAFGYDAATATTQSLELVGQSGTTGITFGNTDDDFAALNLGTNSFNFYGATYTGNTSVYVTTNGLITFGSGTTAYQNDDMSSLTQPAIAVLWDDWIRGSGTPQELYKTFDDNADDVMDRLVVEWNQIYHYNGSTNGMTFQAVLQLNSGSPPGDIFLNYPDRNSGD